MAEVLISTLAPQSVEGPFIILPEWKGNTTAGRFGHRLAEPRFEPGSMDL